MGGQGLPGSGGVPVALLDLTGLRLLVLYSNQLQGTIPDALGEQLQQLTVLNLGNNTLSGTVPRLLTTLKHLTYLTLDTNPQLTGVLPAFNFSQFIKPSSLKSTHYACDMHGDNFTCPLPAGAAMCDHQGDGSKWPPPTCK
jgi:hypothetical protein